MSKRAEQIRILAVINPELQGRFGDRIRSFGMVPVLVSSAMQLAPHIRAGETYHVVLLPASLP